MTHEQLQQIRDALAYYGHSSVSRPATIEAIAILDAELAAPEPQPFCYVNVNAQGDATRTVKRKDAWCKTPLYTAPVPAPQREWVSLSNETNAAPHARDAVAWMPDTGYVFAPDKNTSNAPAPQPIYMFRRKGLDDFCTCTKSRYDELSRKPHLFETKIAYTDPVPAPQPVSMETVYDTIIEWSTAGKGSRRELARRMIALFAAPQREWQNLTPDEINNCAGAEIYPSTWAMAFARAIESKLKEKNHG